MLSINILSINTVAVISSLHFIDSKIYLENTIFTNDTLKYIEALSPPLPLFPSPSFVLSFIMLIIEFGF